MLENAQTCAHLYLAWRNECEMYRIPAGVVSSCAITPLWYVNFVYVCIYMRILLCPPAICTLCIRMRIPVHVCISELMCTYMYADVMLLDTRILRMYVRVRECA